MKIGIDCRTILSPEARYKAGVAHYVYYLVRYLLSLDRKNEYTLFFEGAVPEELRKAVGEQGRARVKQLHFVSYRKYLPYIYSHLLFARQIQNAALDIFHSPANVVPLRLLQARSRPKIVVTVHDLAIYRHPEWFPPGQGFSVKYLVPKTIQLVDKIIAPSQATKRDLVELFNVPESRISIIPHGVEERFFTPSSSPPYQGGEKKGGKYILFVGTLEPRKNLIRLIEAYEALPRDILSEYSLVIAGAQGWKYKDILLKIENCKLKTGDKIKVLGYYPGAKLPELIKGASVFCYPSLYEGFGLPVLEAMAAGVPVVAGDTGSLRELLAAGPRGVPSGLLVDPYSTEAIGQAIKKCIRDAALVRQISGEAVRTARLFTWEKAAAKTLQVYRQLGRN